MRKIKDEECEGLISEIWKLKKNNISLKQKSREQQEQFSSANEELYLELLEALDTVDSLLVYLNKNPDLSPQFLNRLPRAVSGIKQKLLDILARRQVHPIELDTAKVNFENCRVVDYEVQNDMEEHTVVEIIRSGFSLEEKILRPIEVIVSKKQ